MKLPATLPNNEVIKILSVIFGAIPSTLIGIFAVLAFFGALDAFEPGKKIHALIGMLMGVSGAIGAIGSWFIIFDVGLKSDVTRKMLITSLFLGLASYCIYLGGAIYFSGQDILASVLSMLSAMISPIGVAMYHFFRISRLKIPLRISYILAPYVIVIFLLGGQSLLTKTYYADYTWSIDCIRYNVDRCETKSARDVVWINLKLKDGIDTVFVKLPKDKWSQAGSLLEGEVVTVLKVDMIFKLYKNYRIVRFHGIPIPEDMQKQHTRPAQEGFPYMLSLRSSP